MCEISCNEKHPEFNHLLPLTLPPLAQVDSHNHLSPELLEYLIIDPADPTLAFSAVYPQHSC